MTPDTGRFKELDAAVDELAPPVDVNAELLHLTAAFASRLRTSGMRNPVPLIHTVTAPAAARMLLPHLPPELHQETFAWIWKVSVAIAATFAPLSGPPRQVESNREPLAQEELSAIAAQHGAAHAIKLTEACLREYQANPDPVYLLTAQELLPRIPLDENALGRPW
jgi:hypothetical protein